MKKSFDTKKMVTLSAIIAVAMILSYVESLIPAFVAVPGVKLGLSNIATMFALYTLGWPYSICVSLIRVFLSSYLFAGFTSLIYSFSGAVLALTVMILLSRIKALSTVVISIAGAVAHNVGQVIAVCLVMENAYIAFNLAPLLLTGTIAGVVIGLASAALIERTKKYL